MTDPAVIPTVAGNQTQLESWKEIAAYLHRTVRTVQRWEREQGLPVHRLPHNRAASVYAFTDEIDRWWDTRRASLESPQADEGRDAVGAVGGDLQLPVGPATRGPGPSALRWLVAGLAMLLLVLLILLMPAISDVTPASEPRVGTFRAVAVLPLRDATGTADGRDVADGVTHALIAGLSRTQTLRVISEYSSAAYRDTALPLKEVARELAVDALVSGTVNRLGDRVRVNLQLIDARSDGTIWSGVSERARSEVVTLESHLASEVAYELHATLPQSPMLPRVSDTDAFLLETKARATLVSRTPEAMRLARDLFERAIAQDSASAGGYAGLADTYTLLGMFGVEPAAQALPRAHAAAARAIELDPFLADGHVAMGFVLADEGDRIGAFKELERGLDLNPNHAGARHWHALLLVGDARFSEAVAEIEEAARLDPRSPIISSDAGHVYLLAGQVGQAVNQLEQTVRRFPEFPEGHKELALAYERAGRLEDCYRALARAHELSPDSSLVVEHLAWAAARTGRQAEALTLLDALEHRYGQGTVSSSSLAAIYAALGDPARAFRYLERSPSDSLGWARAFAARPADYPRLEALVHDPRFPDFQRRMLALRQAPSWPLPVHSADAPPTLEAAHTGSTDR